MIAIYVHIPFCKQKCSYCDFNSFSGLEKLHSAYVNALIIEIGMRAKELGNCKVDTIYFGGGTPTLIESGLIADILSALKGNFDIAGEAEVSIEANPETVSSDKMIILRDAGFNRISIGFQSLDDDCLDVLGRKHSARKAVASFSEIREAGFSNVNVDLIFGIPDQSLANWALNLEQAVALDPDHISCYGLSVEQGTLLERRIQTGELVCPDEDIQADMMTYARESLMDSGYEHYEISNFAKQGKRCRHNLVYWNNDDYVGFGAGAHSKIGNKRFSNMDDPEDYVKALHSGSLRAQIKGETILSQSEQLSDAIFLGLRKTEGIMIDEIDSRYGCNLLEIYGETIEDLINKGLLIMREGSLRLSSNGLLLGNEAFSRFV